MCEGRWVVRGYFFSERSLGVCNASGKLASNSGMDEASLLIPVMWNEENKIWFIFHIFVHKFCKKDHDSYISIYIYMICFICNTNASQTQRR